MSRFDYAIGLLKQGVQYVGPQQDSIMAAILTLDAADHIDHDELMFSLGLVADTYAKSVYSLLACLAGGPSEDKNGQV